jgi:hypothetical protein
VVRIHSGGGRAIANHFCIASRLTALGLKEPASQFVFGYRGRDGRNEVAAGEPIRRFSNLQKAEKA